MDARKLSSLVVWLALQSHILRSRTYLDRISLDRQNKQTNRTSNKTAHTHSNRLLGRKPLPYLPPTVEKHLLTQLRASAIVYENTIQSLWSGYGSIDRYRLHACTTKTLIVKHVTVPSVGSHPRGWDGKASHERKMRSYRVESDWYQHWARRLYYDGCRVAKSLLVDSSADEFLIVLEDLDEAGYSRRIEQPSAAELKVCLKWLASLHAHFMNVTPDDLPDAALWSIGSYWHLGTREQEFAALTDRGLRDAATDIDKQLNSCRYKTIIHGDAKIANFCFSRTGEAVAAVDFQYVGGGCGIKDVMLLLSSCLDSHECESHAPMLLDYYFTELGLALDKSTATFNLTAIEREWRSLYAYAWADFVRFLEGWSPGHWKVHSYSQWQTQNVLHAIASDKTASANLNQASQTKDKDK